MTEAQIADLARWPDRAAFAPAEKAALAFVEKKALRLPVTDEGFTALRRHFLPREIVKITLLVGNYVSTAIFIQALLVPSERA